MSTYTQFTIRTQRPHYTDKYAKCYIRKKSNGWSYCVKGTPTDIECDVLSNCVGYATGRFCEIYNEIKGTTGCKFKYFNGNPSTVPERIKKYYPSLQMDTSPRPGDMIVWKDHVAICEQVISQNELIITDSAYNGRVFKYYKINNKDKHWGREWTTFLGFVHNPAVEILPDPEPVIPITEPVEQNQLVDQIYVDYADYSNCRIEPSIKGKILGRLKLGWYNVLSISKLDGYTWYKIAEQNYVAKTKHIHFIPKQVPEIYYTIDKTIPAQVTHSIPDKAQSGALISLNTQTARGHKLDGIYIDNELITTTTYTMPNHGIEVVITTTRENTTLLEDIINLILNFITKILELKGGK